MRNQRLHTIPKAHSTTHHPSNDNTSTPNMRTNRPHDVAHASVPVIPSRERVDAAHGRPCAAAPERVTVRRAPPLHPPLGGRTREEPGRGGVGVSEGWAPQHGKRRWGSMRSLGDSHAACTSRPKANPLLIACRCVAVRRGTACSCIYRTCSGSESSPSCVCTAGACS